MDDGPDDVVVPGSGRPSRSAKRIMAAVAVAAVVLAGLAWWVLVVPYEAGSLVDRTVLVDCDAPPVGPIDFASEASRERAEARFEADCHQARHDRRNTALLLGAGVAIAACAVSTVPSRRLTGEKLGPLR